MSIIDACNIAQAAYHVYAIPNNATASVVLSAIYGWPSLPRFDHPGVKKIMESLHKIEQASMPGNNLIDIFPILLHLPKFMSKWKREGDYWYEANTALFKGLLTEAAEKEKRSEVCLPGNSEVERC